MNKYKRLISDTALFGISNFCSKLLVFLLLPLYTGILSTAEYGYIDAMYTLVSLGIPLLTLCVYEATIRFALDKKYIQSELFSASMFVLLIGNIIALVCCAIYGIAFNIGVIRSFLIFLLFLSSSFYLFLTQFIRGINKTRIYAIGGIIQTVFTILFNILFLVHFRWQVNGYILASIFSNLICIFFIIVSCNIFKYFRLNINFTLLCEMIKYSAPLIPNTISWWVNYSLDKYMIIYFSGLEENGLYSVASKLPAVLSTITDIFFKAWQISSAIEYESEGRREYYKKIFNIFFVILIGLSSCMMLFIKIFTKVFLSQDYYNSWRMMPFLIIAVFFSALSGFVGSLCTAAKKTTILFKSTMIGSIINIILNILLIPSLGGIGAAIATTISFGCISVIRIFYMKDIRELKLINKKTFFATFLLLVQAFFTFAGWGIIIRCLITVIILSLYAKNGFLIIGNILTAGCNRRR